MIVHTIPDDGYESYSTSCINLLNFGSSYKPEGFANQYKALACIYVPLDGINEKGLCVADLVNGDAIETHQNTEKPDLTIPTAVRLLLDKAGTVDEAISLLEKYDLNSSVNTSHHFSISDASGKSVVVEYIDNKMVVTETDIVTNHYLSQGEKFGVGEDNSKYRFEALKQTKEVYNNVMNEEQLKTAIQSVSYSGYTQWSIVYNQSDLSFDFYFKGDFNTPYHFGIE